jgi:D-psicose/D-tagatose/L-ribulose 3-epimerase
MYDTFHAHIEEKSVGDAIRVSAKDLVYVHLSENDRSTPGHGQVNWEETFRTLHEISFDGWLVVEVFGFAGDVATENFIWRKTYESELQVARDSIGFVRSSLARSTV